MLSWIGILFALALAVFVVKMGFYQSWALFFNILISIYFGLFVGPGVSRIEVFSAVTGGEILAIAVVAVVCFVVLQWISHMFITSQFSISFSKVFDVLGAGILGFSAGFLVWSFAIVLVSVSPVAQSSTVQEIGLADNQANVSFVCWWCDLVNDLVSSENSGYSTREAIERFTSAVEKKRGGKGGQVSVDPNSPNETGAQKDRDFNDI